MKLYRKLGRMRWPAGWPRLRSGGKAMAAVRAGWGQPGMATGQGADRYYRLTRTGEGDTTISDKVWRDLELEAVFRRIDVTMTPVGRQMLYRQMREYVDDPSVLAYRYGLYQRLLADPGLRESLQRPLLALRDDSLGLLGAFIHAPHNDLPHWARRLWWCVLAGAVIPAGVLLAGWPVALWGLLIGFNLLACYRLSWFSMHYPDRLHDGLRLLAVAGQLAAIGDPSTGIHELQALQRATPGRKRARRALRPFVLMGQDPLRHLTPMANALLALEPALFVGMTKHLPAVRRQFAAAFEAVGALDAALAVASYLAAQPRVCAPRFATGLVLQIRDGVHPLIAGCVPCSMVLERRSVLVTGSNMAGKTSFIKSLALQLVLGRTLGFCLATHAELPAVRVLTSIQIEHSAESGVSHFFSELETLRQFMVMATDGTPALLVIDEIFSGTNTVERIASARAVLERLAQSCMVLVTSHDVELQGALQQDYDLYHFRENLEVEGFFDYVLRTGAATERNAIKLLGQLGFPSEVVAAALSYASAPAD